MNKETSQTNNRFGYKELLYSFKKVHGDLNLSEQKDSYHTIKYLEVKHTVQQKESDNCTLSLSDIRLMENEPFVEKL